MATTILSAIGAAEGGQVGASLGSIAGGLIDNVLTQPSAAALRVQSAAYGEAIPRLYGTIRVSGGILWSTGLKEEGSGLDKLGGGGGRTYSTSLAIGISARPICGVGRIWADGKLIRDASGNLSVAGAIRTYAGSEDQAADSLIVAVEGAVGAPAYRGLAYAVFENLQLGDFANRVPQFGFEVFANAAAPTLGVVASDLFAAAGAAVPDASALVARVDGYGVGGGATLGGAIAQLALIEPHDPAVSGTQLRLRPPCDAPTATILEADAGAYAGARRAETHAWRNVAPQRSAQQIEIGYFDPARDYQAGQQRATGAGATRTTKHYDLPAALTAGAARTLAERIARDAEVARATRTLALPYAWVGIEVGDMVRVEDDPRIWRVRRAALDGMVVALEMEAWAGSAARTAASPATLSDPGRVAPNPFAAQGPTVLRVLDLPAFIDDGGTSPRLWLAVSGDSAWRAAEILASTDGGTSYASLGLARTRAVIGTTLGVLADETGDRWDELNSVEISLVNTDDWLTSASSEAVLAGQNLAAIGGELLAYRNADATGPGRFRLSGLLRGRFGTEFATAGHMSGEGFTLLDPARLLRADLGGVSLGASVKVKAVGPMETASAVSAQSIVLAGANLRPFAPAHLAITRDADGTIRMSWIRRSRIGLGWPDGTDVPLGEASEQYLVTLTPAIGLARSYYASQETLAITPSQQIAQTGALVGAAQASVAQVSAIVGVGPATTGNI